MHVMIHNLLLAEGDKVDYHTYSIATIRVMTNNFIFVQVPEG
jgi:hypothetical protein